MKGRRDWRLAFVVQRWRHVFWISPVVGLLLGVVLFFGFLVGQPVGKAELGGYSWNRSPSGVLLLEPEHLAAVTTDLKSDARTEEIANALVENDWVKWMPAWDLRRRVSIELSSSAVMIEARHPDEEIAQKIASIYYHRGSTLTDKLWVEREKRRREEVKEEFAELQARRDELGSKESARLQVLEAMIKSDDLEGEIRVGYGNSGVIACSFRGAPLSTVCLPNWWDELDLWIKVLGTYFSGGVLGSVVCAYLLEVAFPRKVD